MRQLSTEGRKYIHDSLFPFFGHEADHKISTLHAEIDHAVKNPGAPIVFQDGQFSDHTLLLKPEHIEDDEQEKHGKHGKQESEKHASHSERPREPGDDDEEEEKEEHNKKQRTKARK